MSIYRLDNLIQTYYWGSVTSIPEILGYENPDGKPMAELWMGAHPKAPSRLLDVEGDGKGVGDVDVTLLEAINQRPNEFLGPDVAQRFDQSLPFLFKVLAAQRALSIQAHPTKTQAESGFARENAAGIPVGATYRNYRDANHKPEIICPLTEYWALCGFRTGEDIQDIFSDIRSNLIDSALSKLGFDGPRGETTGLDGFLTTLLTAQSGEKLNAVEAMVAAALRRSDDLGDWICELNHQFPGDIGVIAPAFLNLLKLSPGEAVYLPAGVLHAYLLGTGIELMANSDNVLRGGLTSKHIDVAELTATLKFEPFLPVIIAASETGSGWQRYMTVAPEFELSTASFVNGRVGMDGSSPAIVLCIEGDGTILRGTVDTAFSRGDSFFTPPESAPVYLEGSGTLYRASVPLKAEERRE
jgi:mannose-6-phosphate isomerase